MTQPTVITNDEDGLEAEITPVASGFSVVLRDLDGGECPPTVYLYSIEADTLSEAATLIGRTAAQI